MDYDIRRQADSVQLSFLLPHQAYDPSIYPLKTADGSTIVLYGHGEGLNVLRVSYAGRLDHVKELVEGTEDAESQSTKVEQWFDISTESPITRIAVPPIAAIQASTDSGKVWEYLQSHIVVAVACADSSLRLISFPLAHDAGQKTNDVKITVLNSPATHQGLITSLALTWTTEKEHDSQQISQSHPREEQSAFLVGSASTTGSGLLVVHRVTHREHTSGNAEAGTLLAKQFVRLPLLCGTLAFIPSTSSYLKRGTLLLTSPAYGAVRVLDLVDAWLSKKKRRRGDDNAGISNEDPDTHSLRTLLTLYAPYHPSTAPVRRKEILDAKWVMEGKCIIVLLEDGEWGVWNVDGTTSRTNDGLTSTIHHTINQFAIGGNLFAAVQSKRTTREKAADSIAPTTPHTRKTRSAELFGIEDQIKNTGRQAGRIAGRITISEEPGSTLPDDMVILSYDDANAYIPALRSLWRAETSDGTVTGKSSTSQVQHLPSIRLGGELQLCITKLSEPSKTAKMGLLGVFDASTDLLVVTSSRLMLYSRLGTKIANESSSLNLPLRPIRNKETSFMSRLAGGDPLDVDAMDAILESMENSETLATSSFPSMQNSTTL